MHIMLLSLTDPQIILDMCAQYGYFNIVCPNTLGGYQSQIQSLDMRLIF